MADVSLYNQSGVAVGKVALADKVFGLKPKISLIHQVYHALRANARQPWADTKDRGEVRGGGKKPWKQKGTGRARHGSIRSPIWRHGGVTFGPLSTRNYKQKINQKMKQQAVRMCLSGKVAENSLLVVETLVSDGHTKTLAELRGKLPCDRKTTLLIAPAKDELLLRAAKNIPRVQTVRAGDVNVVDLLHHKYVLTSKAGIDALTKRLSS
ncbi:MAG: 50S ribosomal protein L4 [Candidatus Magasanikbacteria bacterium]|nr:50S ribosomal protein L4 [Candidatus Magasanikbacteria bacterium]